MAAGSQSAARCFCRSSRFRVVGSCHVEIIYKSHCRIDVRFLLYLPPQVPKVLRLPARALARSTICETMREPMHMRVAAVAHAARSPRVRTRVNGWRSRPFKFKPKPDPTPDPIDSDRLEVGKRPHAHCYTRHLALADSDRWQPQPRNQARRQARAYLPRVLLPSEPKCG